MTKKDQEKLFLRVMPEEIKEQKFWQDYYKAEKEAIKTAQKTLKYLFIAISLFYGFMILLTYLLFF